MSDVKVKIGIFVGEVVTFNYSEELILQSQVEDWREVSFEEYKTIEKHIGKIKTNNRDSRFFVVAQVTHKESLDNILNEIKKIDEQDKLRIKEEQERARLKAERKAENKRNLDLKNLNKLKQQVAELEKLANQNNQ